MNEKYWGCEISVFDTGDGTEWCFEVHKDGKLIGECCGEHDDKVSCLIAARCFARWYKG